ncbi:MAG: glycosyltransferase, partial [Nitrospirae bacterium]|nr:glycosyltransferase [Nitrospirota bacterium]
KVRSAKQTAEHVTIGQIDQPIEDVCTHPIVSVVMPRLNESESIGACIEKIQDTFAAFNSQGEIVVCDNWSTDRSVTVTERLGARVAHQPIPGYSNAYLKRFACARGVYLIMGDGVGSCGMGKDEV